MNTVFDIQQATVRYQPDAAPALDSVSTRIERGSFCAVIGPNGSGKSTFVKTLLGAVIPASGTVVYEQRKVADWPRREFAQRVGAVAQIEDTPFPVSVRELVAMGRYPHLGALRAEGETDRSAIAHALRRCDVEMLATRAITTLSGGERQRARIARALAQQPVTLVLDEPTTALDIAHEMAVFELLRSLTRNEQCTVIVATHNLNLAARYADTLLLLSRGQLVHSGSPATVMQKTTLESVYGWPLSIYEFAGTGFDAGAPQVAPLSTTSVGTVS